MSKRARTRAEKKSAEIKVGAETTLASKSTMMKSFRKLSSALYGHIFGYLWNREVDAFRMAPCRFGRDALSPALQSQLALHFDKRDSTLFECPVEIIQNRMAETIQHLTLRTTPPTNIVQQLLKSSKLHTVDIDFGKIYMNRWYGASAFLVIMEALLNKPEMRVFRYKCATTSGALDYPDHVKLMGNMLVKMPLLEILNLKIARIGILDNTFTARVFPHLGRLRHLSFAVRRLEASWIDTLSSSCPLLEKVKWRCPNTATDEGTDIRRKFTAEQKALKRFFTECRHLQRVHYGSERHGITWYTQDTVQPGAQAQWHMKCTASTDPLCILACITAIPIIQCLRITQVVKPRAMQTMLTHFLADNLNVVIHSLELTYVEPGHCHSTDDTFWVHWPDTVRPWMDVDQICSYHGLWRLHHGLEKVLLCTDPANSATSRIALNYNKKQSGWNVHLSGVGEKQVKAFSGNLSFPVSEWVLDDQGALTIHQYDVEEMYLGTIISMTATGTPVHKWSLHPLRLARLNSLYQYRRMKTPEFDELDGFRAMRELDLGNVLIDYTPNLFGKWSKNMPLLKSLAATFDRSLVIPAKDWLNFIGLSSLRIRDCSYVTIEAKRSYEHTEPAKFVFLEHEDEQALDDATLQKLMTQNPDLHTLWLDLGATNVCRIEQIPPSVVLRDLFLTTGKAKTTTVSTTQLLQLKHNCPNLVRLWIRLREEHKRTDAEKDEIKAQERKDEREKGIKYMRYSEKQVAKKSFLHAMAPKSAAGQTSDTLLDETWTLLPTHQDPDLLQLRVDTWQLWQKGQGSESVGGHDLWMTPGPYRLVEWVDGLIPLKPP